MQTRNTRAKKTDTPAVPAVPEATVRSRVITRPTTAKDKESIEAEYQRVWKELDAKFRSKQQVTKAVDQQAAINELNNDLVSSRVDCLQSCPAKSSRTS